MTQKSFPWTNNGTGDGTSGGYTALEWSEIWRQMLLGGLWASDGVLRGIGTDLAVTGTTSPLSVAAGAALVYGKFYQSTAAESLAVTTPIVGTTGGHVILRLDWALQTVRVVAVRNTDGVAAIPSLTQSLSTQWEIRLATFTITTGGAITLTDARAYAHPSVKISTAMYEPLSVDAAALTADAVTNVKLRDSVGVSVIGRSANTTGDPADIVASGNGQVLHRASDALVFAQIVTADIADAAVTPAKLNLNTTVMYDIGAASVDVIEFSQDNVAHGMTNFEATDVFAKFGLVTADVGGLLMRGLTETDTGISVQAYVTTVDTTKGIGGGAASRLTAAKKSGAGAGAMGSLANLFGIWDDTTCVFQFDASGNFYQNLAGTHFIGDTTNAFMTTGVTINQGSADNEIVALKSSDVAHGVTDIAETDTYGTLQKALAANGGLYVTGITEAATQAVEIIGISTGGNTTKSNIGLGTVTVTARNKSGTGTTPFSANENLFVVTMQGGFGTRFIVDADGDIFAVGGQVFANGDTGGVAAFIGITNVSDLSANSSGVGTIKFKGTTSRDSIGFVKIYIGTTAYYVPVFDAITG